MFSTAPVTRLSSTTTSSPRANSASERWEPRKPAPPETTTLAISPSRSSRSTDSPVFEPATAQRFAIEDVASVDHPRQRESFGDLVEVEPLELVPLRQHEQDVGVRASGVRVSSDVDAVEGRGLTRVQRRRDRRIEGADLRAQRPQPLDDRE